MVFSIVPGNEWTLGLGIAALVFTLVFLTINKRQREEVINKIGFARRRASGASTPPRSFSPSKKAPLDFKEVVATTTNSAVDYVNTFPPSRRSALPEITETVSSPNARILSGDEPAEDFLTKNLLPTTQSYDVADDATKYTPTGFSIAEIKAMGDFPAYDVLSGVPLPQPYESFDPAKALPRPYRPLRWAYHQTMSLTKMEPDWWLEVENTYVSRVRERKELYETYGKKVLDYLPGSELSCKELMEMCLQFYCSRYPRYFSLSDDKRTFHNGLLHEDTDIKSTHPLIVLLNNVPEDFAITLRNEEDGMYYFRAGVICSSLGWNVGTKIGLALKDIHKPIPDYKEKMSFSMDRYFSKMPTNAPIQRGSWGLEIGTPLFMPAGHPHEKYRSMQKPDLKVDECYLRVDWQTLRRLPLSAGIVFNFKALFTPVPKFRDEPYIPALLLKILKEGKESLMAYKNTWHVEHVCIPELERQAREQVQRGLVKPEREGEVEWNVTTLNESPYFPGWEEMWHREQGF